MNKPEIETITIHSDNEQKVIRAEPLNLPIIGNDFIPDFSFDSLKSKNESENNEVIGKVFQYNEPLYVLETKIITPLVIKYDEKEVLKLELNGDVFIKGEKVGNCIESGKAIELHFKLK